MGTEDTNTAVETTETNDDALVPQGERLDATGVDENAPIQLVDNGPEELTEEDIALLSPQVQEELAAEAAAAEAAAAEAAEAEAAATAEAERVAAEEAAAAAAETPAQQPAPVDLTAKQQELEALKAQRDDLFAKFDDGELSSEDYRTQNEALEAQQMDAAIALRQAEAETAAAEAAAAASWDKTITEHLAAHPDLATPEHNGTFHNLLLELDKANPDWTDAQLLETAHTRYTAHAIATGKPLSTAPATPEPETAEPETEKKAERPAPVPTLGGAPAAGDNAPTDGAFASLDRQMETDNFGAIDRYQQMTPEQERSYLGIPG